MNWTSFNLNFVINIARLIVRDFKINFLRQSISRFNNRWCRNYFFRKNIEFYNPYILPRNKLTTSKRSLGKSLFKNKFACTTQHVSKYVYEYSTSDLNLTIIYESKTDFLLRLYEISNSNYLLTLQRIVSTFYGANSHICGCFWNQ